MKRRISLLLVVVMILSTLLLGLTGCSDNTPVSKEDKESNEGQASEEETQQEEGKKLDADQYFNYVMYSDPKILDGAMTNFMMDATIIANISQTLTELTEISGELVNVGGGAESWDISKDGLVYTFHLRDFNWEDGKKVTADEYAYTLYRALDPNNGSIMASALFNIKNAKKYVNGEVSKEDVGIKAIDEKTLEITLESVTPYFTQLTYSALFTPTRKDLVEKYGDKYGIEADAVLSCGAFKISTWEHDVKIILEKNDEFWDAENVKLEKVNFKMIRDNQAIMSELMNGTIDRTSVSSSEWRQKLIDTGKFNFGDYVLAGTYFLIFNTEYESNGVKILSNPKIRQAISAAIDRNEATLLLKGDMAIPATGFIPSVLQLDGKNYREASGYNPIESLQSKVSDPKALFVEGLEELGADTDISKYSIEYVVGSTTAEAKRQAEYFQETLKNKLGLHLEIVQVESSVKSKRTRSGDFGMTYSTWYADYNEPSTFFNSWLTYQEGHSYKTGYDNTAYDQYVDEANGTMDEAKRLKDFTEAERLLIEDDCILVPIYHPKSSMMTAKYVKGFVNQNFAPTQFKTVYTIGR